MASKSQSAAVCLKFSVFSTLHRQFCRFLLGRKIGDRIDNGDRIGDSGDRIDGGLELSFSYAFLDKKCPNLTQIKKINRKI